MLNFLKFFFLLKGVCAPVENSRIETCDCCLKLFQFLVMEREKIIVCEKHRILSADDKVVFRRFKSGKLCSDCYRSFFMLKGVCAPVKRGDIEICDCCLNLFQFLAMPHEKILVRQKNRIITNNDVSLHNFQSNKLCPACYNRFFSLMESKKFS